MTGGALLQFGQSQQCKVIALILFVRHVTFFTSAAKMVQVFPRSVVPEHEVQLYRQAQEANFMFVGAA